MRLPERALTLKPRTGGLLAVCFEAFNGSCEVLLAAEQRARALEIAATAAHEAWRIESKYSRYRDDSIVGWIHRSRGSEVTVDAETASLIDFAAECFKLSDGLFDVTSGVLRRAWNFDGSSRVPSPQAVSALLPLVGFSKLRWQSPKLLVPPEMELDFGGFGKEYAVDRSYELLAATRCGPYLVNFGGDLRASRKPAGDRWQVGVERPDLPREALLVLELEHGALTTSGDSRRFLLRDGVRYGHVLDPHTGWPVPGAPRSVTVAASSCTEAGLVSTLALLNGERAREFLDSQSLRYWIAD